MSLSRKASIVTLSRAVTILAQLLATAILTRVLPKEDVGLISFLLLAYSTVQTFGQLGLPDSVFYFFEKLSQTNRKSICLLLGKLLLLIALAGVVALLVIGYLGATRVGFEEVRGLIWIFMLLLIFELPALPLPNVLIALGQAKEAAWLNVFVGIAQFLAMTLPLLCKEPIVAISYSLLLFGVLRMAVSGAIFFNLFKNEPVVSLPAGTVKELFRYSVPLSVAQIFWSLNRQIDKYVVQWFLPLTVYAEYTVGAWELPIIPTIAYSVASVMMPQLVSYHLRGEKEKLLGLWFTSIRKVSVIVLPLVIFFLVAAEEFIVVLFSKDYMNAAIPFRIYTLILLQRVASYSNMQKAVGSTKDITYAAVLLFFTNASLNVPLVLWLGMAGPPLAALLANTFSWWYSLSRIRHQLKVSFREVFPFRFYLKALSVAVLAVVPVFFLKNVVELAPPLMLTVMVIAYFPSYLLAARVTNIIGQEDWNRILRAMKVKS